MQTSSMKQKNNLDGNVVPFRADSQFYFSHGVKAFQRKQFSRAEKWIKKAIECSPDNPLFLSQLSVLYTELHQYHRANELLQRVVELDEDYVDGYYLLANNYAHLGLFQEAKRYATEYLSEAPDGEFSEDVQELISLINQVMLEDLEDELEMDEEDEFFICQESSYYYLEHQEWDKAIGILEEMMVQFPEYIPARHDYAYALFRLGKEDVAITLEESWFKQDSSSIHSRLNLIYFYYHSNQKMKADELIESLNNVYPTYDSQKLKIAVILSQVNACEEAVQRFSKIPVGNVSGFLNYYLWYGYALKQVGQVKKAEQIWEQGRKKHPDLADFIDQI
ncbi:MULTISPECIES: lipopolysaccharide assembly protein LapB [Allobacillus]|uniref:Tetratricopeptide repeat protein n=1 Tax=Allobacillus salarius TaxID=1955272 RepID=A0A556PQV4_9BACI|nr:tetratricopeptide repeat protein [Allobacillus salarius]TSJ66768.1 tetratricopeptide repeat protein [Allobacillus salarius]